MNNKLRQEIGDILTSYRENKGIEPWDSAIDDVIELFQTQCSCKNIPFVSKPQNKKIKCGRCGKNLD